MAKKRTAVLVLAANIILCLGLALWNYSYNEPVETFALPSSNKIVVIDPGHGGVDDGAIRNDVKEKDINLKVALRLRELIEQSAGIAILTRETDVSKQNPNRPKSLRPKTSDLIERRRLANESQADLFISIHMNVYAQDAEVKGAHVFYADNNENSKLFGKILQKNLNDALNDKPKKETLSKNNIFVLKKTDVPAALVECGFLTNPDDLSKLQTDDYQFKVAWTIYRSAIEFFKTQKSPNSLPNDN